MCVVFNNVHVCVSMRVYVHVSPVPSEDGRALEADWVDTQVVVSHLMWVLRIYLWSSARAIRAFTTVLWVLVCLFVRESHYVDSVSRVLE